MIITDLKEQSALILGGLRIYMAARAYSSFFFFLLFFFQVFTDIVSRKSLL